MFDETPQAEIARRAAKSLAKSLDPQLPAWTELLLSDETESNGPNHFCDPVTMAFTSASLLVTSAKLAWSIYDRLKKNHQTQKVGPKVLSRRVRIALGQNSISFPLSLDKQTFIVDQVAKETITY